ncbi:MAG: hypothetical protein ACK5LC_10850 [Coprobacillaceae bacterium]
MATKSIKSKHHGLTKRQRNIIRLKQELNTKRKSDITPFTKYKILTYMFIFLCPPYAMYRVWKKKSTFVITEKVAQTMVCIVYVVSLLQLLV